jgi:hypothetical protein
MRKLLALSLALFLPLCLFAQDDGGEDEPNIGTNWKGYTPSTYSRGDQIFNIHIGLGFPVFVVDRGLDKESVKVNWLNKSLGTYEPGMKLGGIGSLSYTYFFDAHWFIGGELSGSFFVTTGKNNFFMVPIGAYGGYQFVVKRFEFPLSLMAGIAPQTRLSGNYLGFFSKFAAAGYFRINPDWSVGLKTAFWWVPEATKKTDVDHSGKINVHGFFIELCLGARYHF